MSCGETGRSGSLAISNRLRSTMVSRIFTARSRERLRPVSVLKMDEFLVGNLHPVLRPTIAHKTRKADLVQGRAADGDGFVPFFAAHALPTPPAVGRVFGVRKMLDDKQPVCRNAKGKIFVL